MNVIGYKMATIFLKTQRKSVYFENTNIKEPLKYAIVHCRLVRDIYPPLIDPEKVVSNSINASKGINIITGSNMSGKSTFMRIVGINMVLAYAGDPVCAKEMRVSLMELYTCMRVTNDVF